jgi:hypothetical protein
MKRTAIILIETLALAGLVLSTAEAQSVSLIVTKAPIMPVAIQPNWGGLYAGAAFGLGSLHSTINETSQATQTFIEPPTFGENIIDNLSGTLSGQNAGAIGSLFLGYNFVVNNTFVLGGQVEGGVSNIRANVRGTGTDRMSETAFAPPPART